MSLKPLKILLTQAASSVGYSLAPLLCSGETFGEDQPIVLHLFDSSEKALKGLQMELIDCVYPQLVDLIVTTNRTEAFKEVTIAIIGEAPNDGTDDLANLIQANAPILKEDGESLRDYADKNVKVIVYCRPVNISTIICSAFAQTIPKENFTAVTMLDHLRAQAQIARKVGVRPNEVFNVIVWGNQGSNIVPDASNAVISPKNSQENIPVAERVSKEWLENDFITSVCNREQKVVKYRQMNSVFPLAKAVADHIRYLFKGTEPGRFVSMGVSSGKKGRYGAPPNIIFSYPVVTRGGKYCVTQQLTVSDCHKQLMNESADELMKHKEEAAKYISLPKE